MDRRPFQEFAGRLRALADAVENPRTTITELAHAAHACGLTLRLEFIDSGQRDEIEPAASDGPSAPLRFPHDDMGTPVSSQPTPP